MIATPARHRLLTTAAAVGVTIAGLVGAGLPAQAAPATIAVRGTVTVAGTPVVGLPVGTWALGRGVLATARTDSRGGFTLRTPASVAVDVFAGVAPSTPKAVFAHGDDHLVRGVIGAAAPKDIAAPLSQQVRPALPSKLAGGKALRFRLQAAGRFAVATPFTGGTGRISVQHGDAYGPWAGPKDGATTSTWLVPGSYRLYWDPAPGFLPARTRVSVPSGGAVTLTPPAFTPTATAVLRVRSGGAPVAARVPVVEVTAAGEQSAGFTDASGAVTVTGLAAGTHTFVVGKAFVDPDEGSDGPPTSDSYLPKRVQVSVTAGGRSNADVDLDPAAVITGTTRVTDGTYTEVSARDANGDVVRTDGADRTTGAFTLGGLRPGTYTVSAENLDTLVHDRVAVTVAGGATRALTAPLKPAIPDLVVRGRVRGATSGEVSLVSRSASGSFVVTGVIAKSGAWHVRVVPGRYRAVVETQQTVARRSGPVTVTASRTLDLVAGPRLAAARAVTVVNGNRVTVGLQATGPASIGLTPTSRVGLVTVTHAPPGTYAWQRSTGPLPARDGPWYYGVPEGRFTLKPGATVDLGTRSVPLKG